MSYIIDESWLNGFDEKPTSLLIDEYIAEYLSFLQAMPEYQLRRECRSGYNRVGRMQLWSSNALNFEVKQGDICYLDYGQAFINEAGYQHFGLVVSKFNHKVFVVPMTSNREMIRQARNRIREGKKHLYYIGKIAGLNKPSVLFLNDCKFINSSRIISVNAHIDPLSEMYAEIVDCLKEGMFDNFVVK